MNRTRPRWVFPAAFAGGAFAIFSCLIIFSLLAGLTGLRWLNGSQGVALEAGDPQSARVQELSGLVDVQEEGGEWKAAQTGQTVQVGQRLRTGALSSVTLSFYDGSMTRLGPDSEMSVDQLDAERSGPRVIVLAQQLGESQHDVTPSSDPASRYEVHTPSGVGEAKGTSFRVFVTVTLLVLFEVDEGAVAVTNLNTTVIVVAGQATVINSGGAPSQPVFRIKGEGTVEKTGSVWHVAGRTFRTDANTVFLGDPQVGDQVTFQGRIVTDGSPILDQVVLLVQKNERGDDDDDDDLGCLSFSTAVRQAGVNQIVLLDWQVIGLNSGVDVEGQIMVASVIMVSGCTQANGSFIITHIVVVHQLKTLPVIIRPPSRHDGGDDDHDDDDDDDDD